MTANKKPENDQPLSDEEALQEKVDAMMDPRRPDTSPSAPSADASGPVAPPIDIFHDAATAPEVSEELLKQIGVRPSKKAEATAAPSQTEKPAEPVSAEPVASEPAPAAPPVNTESDEEPVNPVVTDPETDKAVDDIAASDSDALLAAQDASTQPAEPPHRENDQPGWKAKLRAVFHNKWTWLGLLAVVIIIFAVPLTRYKLLGLVIKKPVAVTVVDSQNGTPVSNASVQVGSTDVKTDANGKATLQVPLGKEHIIVSKQYYQRSDTVHFTGFAAGQPVAIKLRATGRQVPVTVLNTITGQPISGATIQVLDTSAKTDAKGKAVLVLSPNSTVEKGRISLNAYNASNISVQVNKGLAANTFNLTPAGHVYFLSNAAGTIDVVKTNLDGTGRKVVLAGTGREDPRDTTLFASKDWRYVVLKAHRDTALASMYVIDTNTDKVARFDNSDSAYTPIGWSGHNFMYDIVHNDVPQQQTGRETIKSYDADHAQLNQLDQTQVASSGANYAYQSFSNFIVAGGVLTYTMQWYSFSADGSAVDLSSKTDAIRGVQPNGQNRKDLQTYPAASVSYIEAVQAKPTTVYYGIYDMKDSKTIFYQSDGQKASAATAIDQTAFTRNYPSYLPSPSGSQIYWSDMRDGKNVLYVGQADADQPKQLNVDGDYTAAGWFSEKYVLASKGGNELYVLSANPNMTHQPVKVSAYFKSAQLYADTGR